MESEAPQTPVRMVQDRKPIFHIAMFLVIMFALFMALPIVVYGAWLLFAILGAVHILVFNVLIAYFLDANAAIDLLKKTGRIRIAGGRYYFQMPDFADKRIGLPDGLIKAVWASRAFFLAVCAFGAFVFGPGLYSSVGAYERLLNGVGTIQLGMGVLGARLWHFPLALAIQRRFEKLPADEKYLNTQ